MTLPPQNATSINRVSVYEIIFGAVLSPILFVFYCSILWTLLINRRVFHNPYYKLTVGLGFCHLAMLTRYFYTFWVAYASDYILGSIFDSIMATVAWSLGWHSVITYHVIICINRFVAIMLYDRCQDTTYFS
uniref:G protein-coupled receptor n=1 Tax=Romanomermis culicivorax TaxID=13658 RepID=A0A915K6U2_ROMCU